MAAIIPYKDRVKETATTTGTGDFTLAGAATSFQSFNTAFGTNVYFFYTIQDLANGAWESGLGHLSASTTLVRDQVLASSNSNALVSFAAGSKDVINAVPADQANRFALMPYMPTRSPAIYGGY